MSKYVKEMFTKATDKLVTGFGDVTIEEGVVVVEGMEDVILKHLTSKGVSKKQLGELKELSNEVSGAVTKHVGSAMIKHLKANDDCLGLEYRISTPLVDYGVSIAKPEKETERRSSIGAFIAQSDMQGTSDTIDDLVSLWDEI